LETLLTRTSRQQKNIGITDVTILIVRKDILTPPPLTFLHALGIWSPPTILSWPIIAKNNSLFNTMPIFSIWIAGEVMRSLLRNHGAQGLSGQQELAGRKAKLLYETLDKFPNVYQVVPKKEARSRMNVCFRVNGGDEAAEKRFLEGAEERLLLGLKGHRSVGGIRGRFSPVLLFRYVPSALSCSLHRLGKRILTLLHTTASNYNAVPMENVQKLVDYLVHFAEN